jgi:hypothetical protein
MNDIVLMGIAMAGVIILTGTVLYLLQNRQFRESHMELKSFQMENTRLIHQMAKDSAIRHEENMTFFKGLGYSVGRIVHRLDDESGKK